MSMAIAVAATFPAGAAQRVNLTIDLLGNLASNAACWLKVGASLPLLLFYVLLAWRIGVYAEKLQARAAETIFVRLPMAPFVWTIAVFLALGAPLSSSRSVSRCALRSPALRIRAVGASARGGQPAQHDALRPQWLRVRASRLALLGAASPSSVSCGARTASAFGTRRCCSLAILALLWVLLILYVPLAVVMGLLGLAMLFIGLEPALTVFGNESVQFLTNPLVAVLPMFLMMGSFAVVAGMSGDIYDLAHKLLAHLRGGLALATIGGCAGFGALTGSSLATVATIGRVALPEMVARGYAKGLAAGTVAAGGTLGALVPPSIPLVFYALLTESSIGQLFIAAVVPAIIAVALYLAAISIFVASAERRAGRRSSPPTGGRAAFASARVGSAVAADRRRRRDLPRHLHRNRGRCARRRWRFPRRARTQKDHAHDPAAGDGRDHRHHGADLSHHYRRADVLVRDGRHRPAATHDGLREGLNLAPVVVLSVILLVYFALGAIMDSNTVMFVTIPIVTPLITGMGYDLVWWGIINLVVLETGLITPPFGLHLFVLKSIAGADVPLGMVYRGVMPFVYADLTKLVARDLPWLALWLPSTMAR